MLKSLIVLSDGTELFSGQGQTNYIRSVSYTERVNSGTELTPGSACAAILEASIGTPGGALSITAGDEITLYRVDDTGARTKVGLFTCEKPTRKTSNSYQLTAYDRISWLDKDLTAWLAGLDSWPYPLLTFAGMVCTACGLTLVTQSIPNGDYMVPAFTADGITGRKLMEWIGQVSCRFCRATVDGDVELAWYQRQPAVEIASAAGTKDAPLSASFDESGNATLASDNLTVEDDGDGNLTLSGEIEVLSDDGQGNVTITGGTVTLTPYYWNGLTYEDYQTAAIEKVQLRLTDDDIGVIYPNVDGEVNTYIITGNYLLTASTTDALLTVAQTIHGQLQGTQYTPCKVQIPAGSGIRAGDIVNVTDRNGTTITAYVMTVTRKGQRDTLECTGSPRRDSSSAVNSEEFKALYGKVLLMQKGIEGLRIENRELDQKYASLSLDVDGLSSEVSRQEQDMDALRNDLTAIRQDAQSVSIWIQSIIDNGVDKVKTAMGYTFDDDGLNITKDGEEIRNKLDHTGMYVTRSGETMLQANADGVIARDVTVLNYLKIGDYTRIENYSDGTDSRRTALFWTGG